MQPISQDGGEREERFLITGAHGCIGAWALRELVREGVSVVGFDLAEGPGRAALLLEAEELASASFISGDITRREDVDRALDEHAITHVVHLAGLQLPYCRAEPAAGAMVNVIGTVHVFEAVAERSERIGGVVYASSTGVHDVSLYGAWKRANEATAAAYWSDRELASIGLRPSLVYGVGRDRGVTSSATRAMLAAAIGRPFEISHGGVHQMQYARDIARCFLRAARGLSEGAQVFEPAGERHSMKDVVGAIEAAVPEARGSITLADVPFGSGQRHASDEPLAEAIGPLEWTPLQDAVSATVRRFRELLGAGAIDERALAA